MDLGTPPTCNEKMAVQNPVGLSAIDQNLDGLRNFLNDWGTGKGPERERDEKAAKAQEEAVKAREEAALAHIYASYLKQAEQEDKQLVERWTETSNILLVFSGLQSAIVVAFIIFAETSTDDLGQTNALLQSILYRFDNSTTPSADNQLWQGPPPNDARVSACWYFSFSCSLLCAFGGLLSKQWVIHYTSRPSWANTTTLQCRLRELRHDGAERWKLGWFVDSLIVLTQFSGLIFAIGLAIRLKATSPVDFIIVTSFLALGASVYFFTLVAGPFIPGCPYKLSLTRSLYKSLMSLALFFLLHLPVRIWMGLARLLMKARPSDELSLWIRKRKLWLQTMAVRIEMAFKAGDVDNESSDSKDPGSAGILCWWLAQEDSGCAEGRVDTKMVVDELISFPTKAVVRLLLSTHSFMSWNSKVIDNLKSLPSTSSPSRNHRIQLGELLCDLMHRSESVRIFVLRGMTSIVPSREFCSILRKAWCHGRSSHVLPITLMRWPTISLYLHLQLQSWTSRHDHEDTLDPVGLTRDLAVILQDPRLKEGSDVSRAVALVALGLVDGGGHIGNYHQLPYWTAPERLLQALHLLSSYPCDKIPEELVLSAVRASANQILSYLDDDQHFLTTRHCWQNGDIAGTVLRLLRLALSWRDVPAQMELGEKLMDEVWRMMSRVVTYLVTDRVVTPGWFILSSDEGLTIILQSYGHPSTNPSFNLDALRVVEFVLGLRCYRLQRSARRLLPWTDQKLASTPPDPAPASILASSTHTITQLIHDIETSVYLDEARRTILSALLKGRDIFFPLDIVSADGHLDLGEAQITQLENSLGLVEESYFHSFRRWEEITAVLRQVGQVSLEKAVTAVPGEASSSLDG